MKIAIVHDFLKEYGGAERVVETLHEIWPDAPIYTSFVDWNGLGPHAERLKIWKIKTSWAQKIPFISSLYSPLRFLAPYFFESFDFSDFDVVLTSTNAYYAKGIITKPATTHICYCHTPPRSLYGYATRMNWQKNFFTRVYGSIINHFLRHYDFWAAQRVDFFVANSKVVQRRIEKFYRRESIVIYPPVDLLSSGKNVKNEKINEHKTPDEKYYLYVGKLAAAKNVDVVIKACLKLGLRLKIAGKGGDEEALKKIANLNVEFLHEVSDEELISLYRNCEALLYAAIDEDFGIVPVEAMSFGKPVVAFRSGGVQETLIDGVTGVFFDELSPESMIEAIKKLNKMKFNPQDCVKQAEKFSKKEFVKKIKEFVEKNTRKTE